MVLVDKSQKAPSAKRCIKTHGTRTTAETLFTAVRKHRAPKGALRRSEVEDNDRFVHAVRKH